MRVLSLVSLLFFAGATQSRGCEVDISLIMLVGESHIPGPSPDI